MSRCLIVIPARMHSIRLPGKPLARIAGKPMIVHVVARAQAANLGRTLVATDNREVYDSVESFGFEAMMTGREHLSGTDRVYEVLRKIDPDGNFKIVVNVQGDLPTVNPRDIVRAVLFLSSSRADIVTLCAEIICEKEKVDPNVVKLVGTLIRPGHLRALYFTRAQAPYGDGPLYHHIGLYIYRRAALERFVSLTSSVLERREQLEQLRALENGMQIEAMIVSNIPKSVDTFEDLQQVRMLFQNSSVSLTPEKFGYYASK